MHKQPFENTCLWTAQGTEGEVNKKNEEYEIGF